MQHSSEFVALFGALTLFQGSYRALISSNAVGGTSGIGKSTMYQLVRSTTKPQIYFVGR